jgi:hypothetical protein
MATNDYHFIHRWRIPSATAGEVYEILSDATGLPRWWPSTYLDVKKLEAGAADGVGSLYEVYTKGWLPYTLRWKLLTAAVNRPHGLTIKAVDGDFDGVGVWDIKQNGADVAVTFDWTVRADKPLIRAFSFMLKPLFRFNHNWCMKRGETSLRLELARRHAPTPETAARVPPPPGPTFRWALKREQPQNLAV